MADHDAATYPENLEFPHRQHDGDDHTCMSSVTGFNFELYPESGTMYPALESVPSDVTNHAGFTGVMYPALESVPSGVSNHAASMPKVDEEERSHPLPVLNKAAPSALEPPMKREAPAALEAAVKQEIKDWKEKAVVSVIPTTIPLGELGKGLGKITRKGTHSTATTETIFEAVPGMLQSMPSSPSLRPQQSFPGAYSVQGANSSDEEAASRAASREEEDLQEEEIDVHVHEAHLIVPDEDNQTAPVAPSSRLALTDEVVEGKALPESESRHGKPIVWCLMATTFVVALALLLVFMVGPASDNQGQNHQMMNTTEDVFTSATAAPSTTIWYPPFLEDLPVEVITDIEEKMDSPFYKANQWIWNDPNMDSYSLERLKQRFYLAMMYYATNGDGWLRKDNWLSYDVSECHWFSQSTYPPDSKYYEPNVCDDDSNGNLTVINLSLASNNLTGSWPIHYYAFMPFLRVLDLGDNQIGGVLPTHSGSPYLEVYVLSNNPIGGSLKLNAGAFFDNIKVIRIDGIQTRGNYGGAAFHIYSTGLEVLNSTGYPNDGKLWPDIRILTNLEYVGNGHCNISGTIPTEFGLLTALKELDLSSLPLLSGTIPSELGLLTDLTLLDLAETPLTGTVPSQLCDRVQAGLLEIPADCNSLQCCEGM